MDQYEKLELASMVMEKAKEYGAHLVGLANVDELKKAPSFTVASQMPEYYGVGVHEEMVHAGKHGEVLWPEGAKTVIIVAYAHSQEEPELDYWYGRSNPPGNKVLIAIVDKLKEWLQGMNPVNLPYHVEKGGIYVKDAAVLAGLGCIGKNNLLLTPEYGARVRLRALTINVELPATGPVRFDPCTVCPEYCLKACPQRAFEHELYSEAEYGRPDLPGRRGNYSRIACNIQMKLDEASAIPQEFAGFKEPVNIIKYCRCCEFACPVGAAS